MPFAVLALAACLLMTPGRARPRGRSLDGPASRRPRRSHRPRRADPQRGGLARADLGDRRRRRADGRVVGGLVPPRRPSPAWSRSWSSRRGRSATGRCSAARSRARPSRTPSRSPASTSSPGTIRRPSLGTSRSGPARLLEMRVDGLSHNLFSVLLLVGPADLRARPARPPVAGSRPGHCGRWSSSASSRSSFTSLVFPVATTWGTFLHAAGPVQVLLVVSALLALDAGDRPSRRPARLDATRRVARPGARHLRVAPVLGRAPALVRDGLARTTADLYTELARRMAAAGHPLDESSGPVITNFPIWLAEADRRRCPRPARRATGRRRRSRGGLPRDQTADRHGRRPRSLAGRPRRTRPTAPTASASSISARPTSRPRDRPARRHARLRDRLSMKGDPYTPKRMEAARSGTHDGDGRFDGLRAEATAAVGSSANTLRSIRDRYREAYGDLRPTARRATRDGKRQTEELGDRQAELTKLDLAQQHARADVAVPRARRRRRSSRTRAGRRPAATSPCGSSRRRRPSGLASRRRSTTDRPRRSRTPSSRSSTSSGSSPRIRALAETELRFLRELLRRELGDVRAFISQLRPPLLDELGLDGAIMDTVERIRALTGLDRHDGAVRADRCPLRGRPDGRPARRPGGAPECPQARVSDDRHRDDRPRGRRMGPGGRAMTAEDSTSAPSRPGAGGTSVCSSCASEPSSSALASTYDRSRTAGPSCGS